MKVSDLGKAQLIESKWFKFKRLRESTEKTPRMDGYLILDGEKIQMHAHEVDAVLHRFWDEVQAKASDIGMELDQ